MGEPASHFVLVLTAKIMVRRTVLLILASILALLAYAQSASLRFDHIGLEQGLSESIVLAISQDSPGSLWFGTADGGKYSPPNETRPQHLLKSLQEDARSGIEQLCQTIWAIKRKAMTFEAFAQHVRKRATEIGGALDVSLNGSGGMRVSLELSTNGNKR
jgi:ligand-binding sensor domain-containing protein